jgi:hypothetical protein
MPLTQMKTSINKSFIILGVIAVVAIIGIGIVLRALSMNQDARSQAAKYPTDVTNRRKSARQAQNTDNTVGKVSGEKPKTEKVPKGSTAKNKSAPLYVQYHTWWGVPWSNAGTKKWEYWSTGNFVSTKTYAGENWHRSISSLSNPSLKSAVSNFSGQFRSLSSADIMNPQNIGSYPYLGLYDSADPEIMKYDIIAAKNAGIDAFAVSVFDIYSDPNCPGGQILLQPGGLGRFQRMLDVAQAQNFKIFLEYWVPANLNSKDPNVCGSVPSYVRGLTETLKKTANHPAFLNIDGKPVVSPAGFPELISSMQQVEKDTGKNMYWMVRRAGADIASDKSVDSLVAGNILKANEYVVTADSNELIKYIKWVKSENKGKPVGFHLYPRFDDSFRLGIDAYITQQFIPGGLRAVNGKGENVLVQQLNVAKDANADFIFLESWNDYQEQTAIAPKLYMMGEKVSDPFADLRIIATFKGKTFTPPPLPPRTSIDPLMQPVLFK